MPADMSGKVLGGVSLVLLLVTLGIHLAALAGEYLMPPGRVGVVLLVAEFVLLACFVVSAARHFVRIKPSAAGLRTLFPGWVLPLVLLTAMYSFGSLLLDAAGSGERAVVDGGRQVLMAGGKVVRELDAEEFATHRAAAARVDTGYSLVFLLVPCLWFLTRRDERA